MSQTSFGVGGFPTGSGGGFGSGLYAAALLKNLLGGGDGGRESGLAAWQRERAAGKKHERDKELLDKTHALGQEAADADLRRQQTLSTHQTTQHIRASGASSRHTKDIIAHLKDQGMSATDIHMNGGQWSLGGLTFPGKPAPKPFDLGSDLGVSAKDVTDIDLPKGGSGGGEAIG